MQLKGRRILITGGASGIGQATARMFASEGARLALLDREARALQGVCESIGAHPLAADLADATAVAAAVAEAAQALGGLDGVVNAAGVVALGQLVDMDEAKWASVLAINLTGPYLVCKNAIPHLRRNTSATIVNVASASGLLPSGANAAYASSKAGLIMLSKCLAAELAPIRVNSVCPGSVETPMLRSVLPDDEATQEQIKKSYALGRVARPEEIAQAILFLTSHQSSFITGVALAVDGGRSFH